MNWYVYLIWRFLETHILRDSLIDTFLEKPILRDI